MPRDASYFQRSIVRQLLGTVLFVFGIAASISVATWVRIFSNIFGYSIVTTIQVLVVFLLGLAFGAYYFGNESDIRKNEIHSFLFYNLILGIYTIALLFIFPLITPTIKLFFLKTSENISYLNSFNFFITLFLLIFPSALIGSALPTLGRYFFQSPVRLSHEIGNLTSLLLGGVSIGSVLCSFVLYPIIGVRLSLGISAFLFLLCVSILKILLSNLEPRILLENDFIEKQLKLFYREIEIESRIFRKLINIALLLLGFLFSSFVLLSIRCGYYILDAKIYSSKVLIITSFVGILIGSTVYARIFSKHKNIYSTFAMIPILMGAYGILLIILFPLISALSQKLTLLFQFIPYWNLQLLIYLINATLIILFPSFLVGFGFVLANRIVFINLPTRARIIGLTILLFSLGSLTGLITTGLFFLPTIGIQKSIFFLSITNFIAGLIIMFAYSFQYEKFKRPSLVFIGVVFVVVLFALLPSNFIHKIYRQKNGDDKLIFVKEGFHTTVTIHREFKTNYISLASNGITIGERPERHFLVKQILGHFPMFLHPKPDSILLIGFGDGDVAKRILLHHTTRFDCVEKSSDVVNTSAIFNQLKEPFNKPHFRLLSMNENSYLKLTDQKYNIIVKNCFHPAHVGNNNFVSKEFFQSCKDALTSPGILAVPVPMYGLSIEDFKIFLRTFYEVFPASSVWYNNNSMNWHIVLIGRKKLLNEINVNLFNSRLSNSVIKQDLSSAGIDTIYEALDCFLMGGSELHKLTLGVRINSENNPALEFSAPKTPNNPIMVNHILQLLKSYREPIYPYISNVDTSIANRAVFMEYLTKYYTSSEKILAALCSQLIGEKDLAMSFYQQAYMLNRHDSAAKIFLDNYFDPYLVPSPKSPFEFTENAKIYFQKTEYEKAINSLVEAIYFDKNYSPAYFALGLNYEILGDFETAKQMYQKTLLLNPDLKNVQERLKAVEEMLGSIIF